MIKYLRVKNFQRIRSLKVSIDPHLTVIVGENDRGKSALVRALRWLCLNRPSGKSFIRDGTNTCTVELGVGKHTIKRSVGRHNTYELDGEVFKSFRHGVPEPIQDLLRVQDINFQRQQESAFWFSLSPGQVTKELNKLVDLQAIDRAQAYLIKRHHKVKMRLAVLDRLILLESRQVDSLRGVPAAAAGSRKLNVKMGNLAAGASSVARLALLASSGHREATRADMLTTGRTQAVAAGRSCRSCHRAGKRAAMLGAATGRFRAARGLLFGTPPDPPEPPGDELSGVVIQAADLDLEIQDLNIKIKSAKEDLEEQLEGRCPTCGTFLSTSMELS